MKARTNRKRYATASTTKLTITKTRHLSGDSTMNINQTRTDAISQTNIHLLNSKETAKVLGISERTLWTLTNQGKLPAVKLRKSVRYREEDIKSYIESCLTVQPTG